MKKIDFRKYFLRKSKKNYKIIDSCNDLMLNNFVKILTHGELSLLIIEGEVNLTDLQNAWNKIYSEYCNLSQSKSYSYIFKLSKETAILRCKILAVKSALQSIVYCENDEAIDILKQCKYKYDKENKDKSINIILSLLKTDEVRLSLKEKELNDFNKSQITNKKINESDFTDSLITLSKYIGYHVKATEITVLEYITLSNQYKQYCETLEKQAHGNK